MRTDVVSDISDLSPEPLIRDYLRVKITNLRNLSKIRNTPDYRFVTSVEDWKITSQQNCTSVQKSLSDELENERLAV